MVEEIAPGFYRIPIPLPASLLGSVNAYVVKGQERNLIIDTGMDLDLCMQAMEEGLRRIGVDAAGSDFFITHSHPDHFSLVPRLIAGRIGHLYRQAGSGGARNSEVGRDVCRVPELRTADRIPGQRPRGVLPPELTRRPDIEQVWPFRFVKDADQTQRRGLPVSMRHDAGPQPRPYLPL